MEYATDQILNFKSNRIQRHILASLVTYDIWYGRHGIAELMNWMMGGANSELQYALIICQHCPNLEELDSNSLVYNFHFGSQLKVRRIHYYSLQPTYKPKDPLKHLLSFFFSLHESESCTLHWKPLEYEFYAVSHNNDFIKNAGL